VSVYYFVVLAQLAINDQIKNKEGANVNPRITEVKTESTIPSESKNP